MSDAGARSVGEVVVYGTTLLTDQSQIRFKATINAHTSTTPRRKSRSINHPCQFSVPLSHFSTPSFERRTTASLRSLTFLMLAAIELPTITPYSPGPRDMRCTSACDQRLRRDATCVDTGAAEALALDDRHLHSCTGQPHSQRRPRLPSTDNDRVIPRRHERALPNLPHKVKPNNRQ